MAHKKKDAPRKLYARAKVPFICYNGQYFAPELRTDSAIKLENGDISVEEITEGEGDQRKLVALEGVQGDVTERMTPFSFERKQRVKSDTDTADSDDSDDVLPEEGDEDVEAPTSAVA